MEKEKKAKLIELISSKDIKKRVKKLAEKINEDYKDKAPIVIGILNGSFIFMADLIRELNIPCEIDFLKLSSYGDEKISSGKIKTLKELNCDVQGRDVIVIEDIVDSGLSVMFIREMLLKENPASIKFATLLFKKGISNLDFDIDYIGFKINNEFVIGYGLDFAQKFRNLKAIYVLYN